jgi:hypothetical protein
MFVIVESVLAENLIHCEQILSQDALPIFPWAGYVAGEKHLNPEPRKSDQSECDERAFLPHVGLLHLCVSSIAERRAHCELAHCLMKTDGMRRPVSGRDAVRSQVIDVLEAQENLEVPVNEGYGDISAGIAISQWECG